MASYIKLLRRSGTKVVTRRQWGARFRASLNRFYPPGEYLFVHIAVIDNAPSKVERMRLIERIGVQRFQRTHFPYNDVAFEDGDIYVGQPLKRKGAHTINGKGIDGYPYDLNAHGHAICLPQNVEDRVTDAQKDSIARWAAAKVLSGESTAKRILPHRMFAWKSCPGDKMMAELDDVNRLFRQYVRNGLGKEKRPFVNRRRVNRALRHPGHRRGKLVTRQLNRLDAALDVHGFTAKGWPPHVHSLWRAVKNFQEHDPDLRGDADGYLGRLTCKKLGLRSKWTKLPVWGRVRPFTKQTSKSVDIKEK